MSKTCAEPGCERQLRVDSRNERCADHQPDKVAKRRRCAQCNKPLHHLVKSDRCAPCREGKAVPPSPRLRRSSVHAPAREGRGRGARGEERAGALAYPLALPDPPLAHIAKDGAPNGAALTIPFTPAVSEALWRSVPREVQHKILSAVLGASGDPASEPAGE